MSRIAESIATFGDKFTRRLFTDHEIAYATSSQSLQAERFAARFAAKEATIKALNLVHVGFDWKEIEVLRDTAGQCSLVLRGAAKVAAERDRLKELCVSLSHEGDYAVATVVLLAAQD